MNWAFADLLDFFHRDEGQGSSDNGPLENLLEHLEDFLRRLADFFHAHPCPPDQPSGVGEDLGHQATALSGMNGSHAGTQSGDDPTPGNSESIAGWQHERNTPDGNSIDRSGNSNAWTKPDWLSFCNLPGGSDMTHVDRSHFGDEEDSPPQHSDNDRVGSNLAQLVQAMGSQLVNGAGFDPVSTSHIAIDAAPQVGVAAVWHQ
jgi:hypothetical protein